MLDDIKLIHQKDSADALGIAAKTGDQLRKEFDLAPLDFPINNVVYAGMGGSALAAVLAQTWPGFSVPFTLVRDYTLPAFVNEHTLVMVCSYSGNTEEAISALDDARKKNAKVVVLAGGGALMERARAEVLPFILLPKAAQPRYAVLYNLRAIVDILSKAKLTDGDRAHAALNMAAVHIEKAAEAWIPTVPTAQNPAKQLALELIGKSVVVYSGPKLFPAAYKWKISINENAKQIAWCNQYPEFNHNEILGWTEQPTERPYAVVNLLSSFEHPRVLKRLAVTERLLSGKKPAANIVQAQGSTILEQLLWTVSYGDFVSLYMSILNGLDPAPVELIERFKKALND